MTTLYLIRHGETEWNRERRFQGWLDSPLTAEGRGHADANGQLLARLSVSTIWASPLGRVRETVAGITRHVAVAPRFDERLKECNVGEWEGLTLDAARERDPADWQARTTDLVNHRPPRGESLADVEGRVAPFLRSILPLDEDQPGDGERIAIVSHGLMTRVILRVVLGAQNVDVAMTPTPNDGVYRVEWEAGVLGAAPEISHYLAGQGPAPGFIPRRDH